MVGRHPACSLRLTDPKVSAFHCLLLETAEGVHLVDLQSRNGTLVDGARVHDILLRRAASLKVGDQRLWLREKPGRTGRLILPSPPMRAVYDLIARVAPADAPVLLHGECGVGKDGLAEELHRSQAFLVLFDFALFAADADVPVR